MADPLIINPRLTTAGQQAAVAASTSGISLNLTHISFGQGKYDPTGNEVALKTPISTKVTLAGGTRPTATQLRMLSAWRENIGGEKPITEIGFWSNNTLVFIWSTATGQSAFTKTDGVTAVHFVDLALSSVPAVTLAVSIDPAESVALGALAAHEGASNAHPDYVKHSLFPDAQSDLWAEVVGGSANAIALTMPDEVVLDAYRKGQVFRFVAAYTNTSTVTININGLGSKPVVKSGGNALIPSDLKVDSVYDVVYDGTRFQLNGGVGGGQFYIEYPTVATSAKQTAYKGTYSPGSVMVFVGDVAGGEKLPQSSFTATDGQNVTLTAAAAASIVVGTQVTIVALSTFAVADTYTKGEYQSFAATQSQARDLGSKVLDRWMSPQRVHEAVIARIQASMYDGAAGRLLVPGSFGLGALALSTNASINALTVSGIYGWDSTSTGRPIDNDAGEVIHMVGDTAAYASQLVTSHLTGRAWFRRKSNNVWTTVELFHSDNQLALGTTPAAARTALELGTAAGADLTTTENDSTLGRVLRVGDFGIGRKDLTDFGGDLNALVATGFYFAAGAATNMPAGQAAGMLIVETNANNNTQQLYLSQGVNRMFQRASAAGAWTPWVEFWHSGNLAKTTSNSDTTLGSLLKVGDFGIGAKSLYTNNLLATVDDPTLGNGMYAVSNTTTGTKPAVYGILFQEGRNNVTGAQGRVIQTFYDTDQPLYPRIYHRIYIAASSTWGAWVEDWTTATLEKTVGTLDTTVGRMIKVGDYGFGTDAAVKSTFTADSDWAKPSGWSGFIDVLASKAKGVTFPSGAMFVSSYVIWNVLGRRDAAGGYVGILTDYASGRSWMGYSAANTTAPTFSLIYSTATTSTFIQSLMDDADQTAAQVTLGIGSMINGITNKTLTNANVTLTAAEANVGVLYLTGALTADVSVIVPSGTGIYDVYNLTTGNFTVTIRAGAASNGGVALKQGRAGELVVIGTGVSYANSGFGAGHFDGEVMATNANNFRIVSGSYGTFWRNDGGALYLMLTNSGDQYGNYNARRPFAVNLATGKVAMSEGLTTLTLPDGTATLDAANCLFVQNALAVWGIGTLTVANVADLDAVRAGGFYRAGATTLKIPPLAANYSVMVQPFNDGGCMQVATQLGGQSRSFTRTQAGGGWTAWRESLYSDAPTLAASPAANDISKLVATTESVRNVMAAHGLGTADLNDQVTGIDLNDMRTSGWWQVNSALNAPTGFVSGVLTTVSNATYYTQQTFMPQGVNRMYQRASNGQSAGFTPWREIAGTDYVDSLDAKGVGQVSFYAMNTPPAGKFKCNGAAVSRTTYAALFAKIGTMYGVGDGSTTFNIPDMRGYFPRAWDDGRGVDAGRAFGSTQASQNLSHGHTGTASAAGAHNHTTQFAREKVLANFTNDPNQGNAVLGDEVSDGYQPMTSDTYAAHTHALTIAASGGSEARPVNVALLACIQY